MPRPPPGPTPLGSTPPRPAGPAAPPDLDLLRRQSGLSIDGEGRFLHRGEPISHARTLEVLWGSLEAAPDGRWQAQIGRERGDVAVEETPWLVRGLRAADEPPGALTLLLCGGREAPLDPSTLRAGADGILRCRLPGGALARFTRAGQSALGERLQEDPDDPNPARAVLVVGGVRYRLPAGEPVPEPEPSQR